MTKLEQTIKQLFAQRTQLTNQEKTNTEKKNAEDKKARRYDVEFNSIYKEIKSIDKIEQEFIEWANKCNIDDRRKEITDGNGYYKHLLAEAHQAYQKFREEGYEIQTAFDKGTIDLIHWIKLSTEKATGGTIYLNHSQQFLSRIRHMEDY